VSYDYGPRLLTELGSSATMSPTAPDLASRLSWTPVLPRVLCLPAEVGSDAAMCLMAPGGPWASSIKKSLVVLPVQLGTHVPNAHTQVFKAPDRACMTCGQASQSMPTRRADMQLQCDYSILPAL
jgi:hypothetical protein